MSTLFRDKLTGSTFGPWGKVQEERGGQDLQGQAIPSRQDEIRAICAWPSQSCVIWDKSRSHLNQKKKTQQILRILNCRRAQGRTCVAFTRITEERRKDSYDQDTLPAPGQETARQPP